jgi:hypothetical protein
MTCLWTQAAVIADQQRGEETSPRRGGEHQHLLEPDRHGRRVTEHGHRGGVADQHDVDARLLRDAGGRVVVCRDHHDPLSEPLLLGEARQRHRQRSIEIGRDWHAGGG